MKRIAKTVSVLSVVMTLSACGGAGPKIDPMSYQMSPADSEKITVPAVCQSYYKIETPRVAVTEFINNTTYGDMTAENTNVSRQSSSESVAAGRAVAVAGRGSAAVGYAEAGRTSSQMSGQVDTFYRQISPKVGEYGQSAVENAIAGMGGAQVFDRKQLNAILAEQKMQMTMADPATAVKFGKIAGVQYIITGTVDNITTKYIDKVENNSNTEGKLGAALAVGTVLANTQTGWNVMVEMTVQLIDVESGRVVISEKVKGREVAGNAKNFNPEMSLTAAKKAMGEAVEDIRPAFSEKFAQKGYIQQLRGNKSAALVNIGSDKGLKSGQKLEVFDFAEIIDPMTNIATCNISVIPAELTVSEQVQPGQSWVKIERSLMLLPELRSAVLYRERSWKGKAWLRSCFKNFRAGKSRPLF